MDTSRLFSNDGITFRSSRTKAALFGTCSLAMVALGMVLVFHPEFFPNRTAAFNRVLGWASMVLSFVGLAASAIPLVRPATVRFSSEGLTIETAWRTYTRPWSALSNFRFHEVRGGAGFIYFDDEIPPSAPFSCVKRTATGATMMLPGMMNVSREQLLEAAQRSKEHWG